MAESRPARRMRTRCVANCARKSDLVEFVTGVRWWSAADLATVTEPVFPKRLPELVAQLRETGPPPQPIDAGI